MDEAKASVEHRLQVEIEERKRLVGELGACFQIRCIDEIFSGEEPSVFMSSFPEREGS